MIELTGYSIADTAKPVNLTLAPGVIGLAGLERAGQETFLECLAGLRSPTTGRMRLEDRDLGSGPANLQSAAKHGIAYLPRDRKVEGIFAGLSVLDNFRVSSLRRHSRAGVIDSRKVSSAYARYADKLGIVCRNPRNQMHTLSGGNQQKVLLARWLARDPRVLLLNDPSRGVDHRTKLSLHEIYREVAAAETTVVLLSSEIEELLSVADRVLVFHHGQITQDLAGAEIRRDRILAGMFGEDEDA